ncbi:MAG: hypothetical protein GKR90_23595 [Pseudomonadales bacterium]|nr:hypothetical protein [Pseudomonadales bacterium]
MDAINPKRVIVGALASVVAELPTLGKALLGPGIVYMALNFIPNDEITIGIAVLLAVSSLVLHTVFAITTHRIVMLGSDSVPEWGLRSWSRRETRFAGYVVALVMMLAVLITLAIATQPIGPIIVMVVAVVGGCSLSLVFPAIALEEEFTLGDAWRMAQGHISALILCIWLFPFLLAILAILVAQIPYARPLAALMELVTTILTIATLSVAFSEIRRQQSET